jgi:hypothetical protein
MELKTLKNIYKDLEWVFTQQKWSWMNITNNDLYKDYKRRENDLLQLKETIEDIEKKQEALTNINVEYPRLSNIRIPIEIDIEIERQIKLERMDTIEKGAKIGIKG